MTIEQRQQEIVAEFADIEDWMDRYGYIIDLGNALTPLPDELKTPDMYIQCILDIVLDSGRSAINNQCSCL